MRGRAHGSGADAEPGPRPGVSALRARVAFAAARARTQSAGAPMGAFGTRLAIHAYSPRDARSSTGADTRTALRVARSR